ncbi:ABC transporter ATP-binding protein [candidate division KSB1 bacterium]
MAIDINRQELIINIENLNFSFLVPKHGMNSIKQFILKLGFAGIYEKKHVLKDIDLKINKGECFGLIGKNGSGKSTLLRTIAGIITPDSGKVTVKGKVAPMLALGVGLEPELSGFENIKLVGALLGFSAKDITTSIEDIISFSELSRNDLKMQVRRFSSGMLARLSFAIAVSTQPEILLVDEVLAVGDIGFQKKCVQRIDDIRNSGSTIVYVAHHIDEIKRICTRAAWMDNGQIMQIGQVEEIAENYSAQFL